MADTGPPSYVAPAKMGKLPHAALRNCPMRPRATAPCGHAQPPHAAFCNCPIRPCAPTVMQWYSTQPMLKTSIVRVCRTKPPPLAISCSGACQPLLPPAVHAWDAWGLCMGGKMDKLVARSDSAFSRFGISGLTTSCRLGTVRVSKLTCPMTLKGALLSHQLQVSGTRAQGVMFT